MCNSVKKAVENVVKSMMVFAVCFLFGGTIGTVVDLADMENLNIKLPGYEDVEVNDGSLTNEVAGELIIRAEGEDIDEQEKSRLDWLFKAKMYELSKELVSKQLTESGYKVKLVDELVKIPANDRTVSVQQQIIRGSEYLVVDHESRTIWCEYEAPENVLSDTILSIN